MLFPLTNISWRLFQSGIYKKNVFNQAGSERRFVRNRRFARDWWTEDFREFYGHLSVVKADCGSLRFCGTHWLLLSPTWHLLGVQSCPAHGETRKMRSKGNIYLPFLTVPCKSGIFCFQIKQLSKPLKYTLLENVVSLGVHCSQKFTYNVCWYVNKI